ncbi:extracellular solute-binding protein [Rossellomorea vietnamensis]|uniref:extracellular solute-binding protein n=1 Tax=Rossellomorea vietnamensis TaxID=218284 RepID=UPI001CCC6D13|nr:extracellular solute-binding protein [Rossellomorea vietnamensis]MCA0149722.1 extracellular solute-binding protein [Rossellomorea vietnamensis]
MIRFRTTIILILLLILNACGNQHIIDESKKVKLSDENSVEEIEIWHTYSDEETRIFENEIIPLFEEKYPGIDVKSVRQPHSKQLMSALISRASVNRTPDVVRMDITWIPKFVHLDLLYPISEFDDFDLVKSRFLQNPLESNRFGKNYYGLPLNTNVKAAIYNKAALEKLKLDQLPETMDELIGIVKEHNLKIGISDVSPWNSLPYFYGLGGKVMNKDYTKASGYLDSKESISALKELLGLYQNGYIPPEVLSGYAETWQNVSSGDYFMIDEGPWFYSVRSENDLALVNQRTVSGVFPSNGEERSILGGENAVITKGTKHREASWTFVKWMTTEEPQSLLLKAGLLPTNKRVEISNFAEEYPYYKSYIESIDEAFLRPPVPQWEEINTILTNTFKNVFSGEVSVEEGLKKAAADIDRQLSS